MQHANISPKVPLDTLEKFYEATRVACEEAKNEVSQLRIAASAPIASDLCAVTLIRALAEVVDKVESETGEALVGQEGVCSITACRSTVWVVAR